MDNIHPLKNKAFIELRKLLLDMEDPKERLVFLRRLSFEQLRENFECRDIDFKTNDMEGMIATIIWYSIYHYINFDIGLIPDNYVRMFRDNDIIQHLIDCIEPEDLYHYYNGVDEEIELVKRIRASTFPSMSLLEQYNRATIGDLLSSFIMKL